MQVLAFTRMSNVIKYRLEIFNRILLPIFNVYIMRQLAFYLCTTVV